MNGFVCFFVLHFLLFSCYLRSGSKLGWKCRNWEDRRMHLCVMLMYIKVLLLLEQILDFVFQFLI